MIDTLYPPTPEDFFCYFYAAYLSEFDCLLLHYANIFTDLYPSPFNHAEKLLNVISITYLISIQKANDYFQAKLSSMIDK